MNASIQVRPSLRVTDDILGSILAELPEGEPFDAAAVIAAHPEIQGNSDAMADLAYEEFIRRQDLGEDVNPEAFVSRFPSIASLLYRMFDFCEIVKQSPELFVNPTALAWPEIGSIVGQFELVQQIGSGSFSRVYEALDLALPGRHVVLKLTTHAHQEAEALGRLTHRNIVSPYGLFTDLHPDFVAIAMPSVGRATLVDLAKDRPQPLTVAAPLDYGTFLSENGQGMAVTFREERFTEDLSFVQRVAWIGATLADALAYAHSKNFVHCDIKPSNVLLCADGQPMLLDFNLSQRSDDASVLRGGTLAYMSPEQLRGLGAKAPVGGAADVFSLGATLIEVLTGEPPFGRDTNSMNSEKKQPHPLELSGVPYRIAEPHRRAIGPDVSDLLESCLVLDPSRRPTPAELSRRLRNLLPREIRLPRWMQSRRFRLAATVTALTIPLFGMAGYRVTHPSPEQSYRRGMADLTELNRPDRAVHHFSRLIQAEPGRRDLIALRACAEVKAGQYREAFSDLNELREGPGAPMVAALLGYVTCQWHRDTSAAEMEYERAYRGGYRTSAVLNNLAYCKYVNKKYDAARELLREAQATASSVEEADLALLNLAFMERRAAAAGEGIPSRELISSLANNPRLTETPNGILTLAKLCWQASADEPEMMERAHFHIHKYAASRNLDKQDEEALVSFLFSFREAKAGALPQETLKQVVRELGDFTRLVEHDLTAEDFTKELTRAVASDTRT
ncbi:protein kinase domain-containing protein [Planctomicrobium sp. SH664]|uniref:serine/threonine-protein kinase n=1 Tax=Planctomicrobium sp. SH664 TaxID=3448125 RepID=UPI003F5BEBC7